MISSNILEVIGHTPLIRLNRMVDEDSAEILVKFEGLNVGGSIKTRTAYNMIKYAEEEGLINKVISTNLTYRTPELQAAPWFVEADMSKYIAYIIATLNHDRSLSKLLSPQEKIRTLTEKYVREQNL